MLRRHRRRHPPVGAVLRRHAAALRRLRRGHDRHRHADPHRQHHLDGRVRPRGRQRQRHRRDGLRRGGDGAQEQGSYKRARQILADLDAVGNTTKAETKGIAIGSAVIAAVSLFASFIAVIAVGSEDKISQMTTDQYLTEAGKLTVADPMVFIGFLLGGAVPFLFSSHADPRRRPRRLPDRQGMPRAVPRRGHLGRAPRSPTTAAWSTSAPPRRRRN